MALVLWLVGTIIAGLISIALTLIFSDPLKRWAAPIIRRIGAFEKKGIEGLWLATFSVDTMEYNELVELTQSLGVVFGRIKRSPLNYDALQILDDNQPLRVRGEIVDNTYFTGVWFHPLETHRFHGAFQLVLQPDGEHMVGKWIGFSQSMKAIDSGRWLWRRHAA